MQAAARQPNLKAQGYVNHKKAGKLWVRERIEQLVDVGTFVEIGSISGTVVWKKTESGDEEPAEFTPSNNVQGAGLLRGRKALITVDDFTIRAGHADGASSNKTLYLEKLAVSLQLPIIKLVDGSSGGGSVTLIRTFGASYLPYTVSLPHVVQQLNMGIPNLAAVVGPAVRLSTPDFYILHQANL